MKRGVLLTGLCVVAIVFLFAGTNLKGGYPSVYKKMGTNIQVSGSQVKSQSAAHGLEIKCTTVGFAAQPFYYLAGKAPVVIKSISIFTRNGQLLFHAKNVHSNEPAEGWDGQFNGETLSKDILFYRATVSLAKGKEEEITGFFKL
jgi:gliding motility-associated-like protein